MKVTYGYKDTQMTIERTNGFVEEESNRLLAMMAENDDQLHVEWIDDLGHTFKGTNGEFKAFCELASHFTTTAKQITNTSNRLN